MSGNSSTSGFGRAGAPSQIPLDRNDFPWRDPPKRLRSMIWLTALIAFTALYFHVKSEREQSIPRGRQEVVFWHFWGGRDQKVVDDLIARFNDSQDEYFVRGVVMPGHHLDLKFFLSVAGDQPPDILAQDDPVLADWTARQTILPLDEVASRQELAQLSEWLLPAAASLGQVDREFVGLCVGLDIRAMYFDRTLLEELGASPPKTLQELDALAERIAPSQIDRVYHPYGYLPDPTSLWAWGIAFGGEFQNSTTGKLQLDDPNIVRALDWMAGYARRYDPGRVLAVRSGEQALTGSAFPLLRGNYAFEIGGQWRVREIAEVSASARAAGRSVHEYGVIPLPEPEGGRMDAGRVNGNVLVIPRQSRVPAGAWEFMKFWSGFDGNEKQAARTCVAGGWIPVSRKVVDQPEMQDYLRDFPLFGEFVRLAGSPHQRPIPLIRGASLLDREVVRAAEEVMYRGATAQQALARAQAVVEIEQSELENDR